MSPSKLLLNVAVVCLVAAGVGYTTLNYETWLDRYAIATFQPTSEVKNIEGRLNLTEAGRGLLYRSKTVVDDKLTFNTDCNTARGELELGCFYRNRMYVLRIDNASLAPEMDTVTAHELLHASWTRMSQSERTQLGRQLEAAYARLNDPELQQRMASYAKSEPGQQDNELHSILGTEYAHLTPELEDHYARYFTNRGRIVAAHAAYQGVFTSRRQELEQELAGIRTLKGQLAAINQRLDAYRRSQQIETYNSLVPTQNRLVDTINSRIAAYQRGVDEYNSLSRSLDSQQITDTEAGVQ